MAAMAAANANAMAATNLVSKQLSKTRMCSLYNRGVCRDNQCRFAHSSTELRTVPNLKKTSMCRAFLQGQCNATDCKYAHGESELRMTDGAFKTQLCNYFQHGSGCKKGDTCRHAHGTEELRLPNSSKDITSPVSNQMTEGVMRGYAPNRSSGPKAPSSYSSSSYSPSSYSSYSPAHSASSSKSTSSGTSQPSDSPAKQSTSSFSTPASPAKHSVTKSPGNQSHSQGIQPLRLGFETPEPMDTASKFLRGSPMKVKMLDPPSVSLFASLDSLDSAELPYHCHNDNTSPLSLSSLLSLEAAAMTPTRRPTPTTWLL